jgi:hypothetical protein
MKGREVSLPIGTFSIKRYYFFRNFEYPYGNVHALKLK